MMDIMSVHYKIIFKAVISNDGYHVSTLYIILSLKLY